MRPMPHPAVKLYYCTNLNAKPRFHPVEIFRDVDLYSLKEDNILIMTMNSKQELTDRWSSISEKAARVEAI
jgi:hypothetical protein